MHTTSLFLKALWAVFWLTVFYGLIYPFTLQHQPESAAPEKQQAAKSTTPTAKASKPKPMADIPEFAKYRDVRAKKAAFFEYLKPVIKQQNDLIRQQRAKLINARQLIESGQVPADSTLDFIGQLAEEYRIDFEELDPPTLDALLRRVDVVPMELVLVQAANESAWGTSRFARYGYNFFGMWCYKKGCGFVPARRNTGANHEVAKFSSVQHAVRRYLLNINTHNAYKDLRRLRQQQRLEGNKPDAETLALGLINYSERREAYVAELLDMIDHNQEFFK